MFRRITSPTYAFCASLVVHATIVLGLTISYIRAGANIHLPGFATSESRQSPAMLLPLPPDATDTPLGEMNGTGHSIDPTDGDRPQEARRAEQSQLFLSRDPAGPGELGNLPSMSLLRQGPPSIAMSESLVPEQQAMIGVQAPAMDVPELIAHRAAPAKPQGKTAAASSVVTMPRAEPEKQPQLTAAAPPADPAPMADSETDPFSVADGARFVRGREIAQFGRKHKLVRPRLTLAGQTALLQLPSPIIVVLRLHLDAAGNVTRAEIARTSGSEDIDQPCKVAAYQWWLEPTRDRSGDAIADVVPFVIRFD